MKKVLAVSLGLMVGVAFGSSAVMASPDLTAHQFKIIQEHQNTQSLGSQAVWQDNAAVTPLRGGGGGGGGYGGGGTCDGTGRKSGSGPKDGSGNKYGK